MRIASYLELALPLFVSLAAVSVSRLLLGNQAGEPNHIELWEATGWSSMFLLK